MTIYPLDEEKSKKGAEDVKSTLSNFFAVIILLTHKWVMIMMRCIPWTTLKFM